MTQNCITLALHWCWVWGWPWNCDGGKMPPPI